MIADVAVVALSVRSLSPAEAPYAQVEVVTLLEGTLMLLELELAEPSLFLRAGPPSALIALTHAIVGR